MARVTKAQQEAEYVAEQERLNKAYDQRRHYLLLGAVAVAFNYLKASLNAGFGDANVLFEEALDADGMPFYRLVVESSGHYSKEHGNFTVRMTDRLDRLTFESELRELEQEVSYLEGLAAEQKRQATVRATAMAKLNDEERRLLGL